MKIPAVRNLVENVPVKQLREAKRCIVEDKTLSISVEGDDAAEQLAHVFAAIFILEKMQMNAVDFEEALLDYSKNVREKIQY